jgi:T4-like virus tail tube protein gp19
MALGAGVVAAAAGVAAAAAAQTCMTSPGAQQVQPTVPPPTVTSMGIGQLGVVTLKRKFRYLFGLTTCGTPGIVPPDFVKTAGRPSFTVEETQLDFLNERIWIPGKGIWETITVTYYDAASSTTSALYSWLATVYNFTNLCRFQASDPKTYGATGTIMMLDGCGNLIETWQMLNMWPTSVKFGDLDYTSSDVTEIELTLRYSGVTYTNVCPGVPVTACPCGPCVPGT